MPLLISDACSDSETGASTEVSGKAIEMLRESGVNRGMLSEAGQKKTREQF